MTNEKAQAHTTSRIYVVQPVEGPSFLLVEVSIDCPVCGQQTLQLAGHHLRLVRDVILEAMDRHPELTCSGESQIVERWELKGVGNDPTTS